MSGGKRKQPEDPVTKKKERFQEIVLPSSENKTLASQRSADEKNQSTDLCLVFLHNYMIILNSK